MNYVRCPFWEGFDAQSCCQEAAALASLAMFVGMIAIWSQVIGSL